MTPVVISVEGTQQDETGEEQRIELVTAGRYYRRQDTDYITYDESELTGLKGTTTLLKIYSDHVVLVRMGTIEQRQEFRTGERNLSTYVTPYGAMNMIVATSDLNIAVIQGIGQIVITYELEIEGRWQSSNRLAITIREDKKTNGH